VLKRLEGTFDRTLLEIMTAIEYGFSVSERVWEERDGRIVYKALKVRKPDDFVFEMDAFGNVLGLRQANKALPLDKFIVWSYDYEFGNPYGKSDLEATYRPWWLKSNAYAWMGMLMERLGIPPIFALYNANAYGATKQAQLADVVKNLQAASTGIIPRPEKDDLEMWSPELAGQVSTVFIPAFEMLDKAIAKSLLMPGLIGMGGDSKDTGSMARAKVQFDVFVLALERIRSELADRVVQEQIIRPLVELNFGDLGDDMPCFHFLPLTDDVRADLLTTWKDLCAAKVVKAQDSDEEHIRAMLDFPEANPAEQEKRAQADMERAAAAIEATTKAQGGPTMPGKPGDTKPPAKKFAMDDEEFERFMTFMEELANADR
jgi:phage gp29-like protein